MDKPKIAACFPKQVEFKAGDKYAYCTCGLSSDGALCDGSHKGTEFRPQLMVAEKDEAIWICQCKHTSNAPCCDGTHKTLES